MQVQITCSEADTVNYIKHHDCKVWLIQVQSQCSEVDIGTITCSEVDTGTITCSEVDIGVDEGSDR